MTTDPLDRAILDLARHIRHATDLATRELEHATWPTQAGEGGPTTGGQRPDPTERVATGPDRGEDHDNDPTIPTTDDDKYRDYRRIVEAVQRAASHLGQDLDRLTPRLTGHPCIVPACRGEGLANRDGRCWQCADFHRRNRYDPPAATVRAWNSRRPKPCQCGDDDCLRMVPPGDGNIHSSCRSRRAYRNNAS